MTLANNGNLKKVFHLFIFTDFFFELNWLKSEGAGAALGYATQSYQRVLLKDRQMFLQKV